MSERWRIESDQNDSWHEHRIYDDETLIVNVLARGSAGRDIANQIVRDHNAALAAAPDPHGTTALTFKMDDLPELKPIIRTHAHELAPDARDAEIERLRVLVEAMGDEVSELQGAIGNIGDEVNMDDPQELRDKADNLYAEAMSRWETITALQASPERPAQCSVVFNNERVQGRCPYQAAPGNDMCVMHDQQRVPERPAAGER